MSDGPKWIADVCILMAVGFTAVLIGSARADEIVDPELAARKHSGQRVSKNYRAQLLLEQCRARTRIIRDASTFDDCPDETIVQDWVVTGAAPGVAPGVNKPFFVSDLSERTMWCGSEKSAISLQFGSATRIDKVSVTFATNGAGGVRLARLKRARIELGDHSAELFFATSGEQALSQTGTINADATVTSVTVVPEDFVAAYQGQPYCIATIDVEGRGVIAADAATLPGSSIFFIDAVPPQPFLDAIVRGAHVGVKPVALATIPTAPVGATTDRRGTGRSSVAVLPPSSASSVAAPEPSVSAPGSSASTPAWVWEGRPTSRSAPLPSAAPTVETTTPVPSAQGTAAPSPGCDPPFTRDDQGRKHFKPECYVTK